MHLTTIRTLSSRSPQQPKPPSSRLLFCVMVLWGLFVRWVIPSAHSVDHAEVLQWLLSDRPMLHVTLQSHDKKSGLVKYAVLVRIAGETPIAEELAVSDGLVSTLSFATPESLMKSALQLDIQIAGIDDRGCIVEGGSQQWQRAAKTAVSAASASRSDTIVIEMKPLPHALCVV